MMPNMHQQDVIEKQSFQQPDLDSNPNINTIPYLEKTNRGCKIKAIDINEDNPVSKPDYNSKDSLFNNFTDSNYISKHIAEEDLSSSTNEQQHKEARLPQNDQGEQHPGCPHSPPLDTPQQYCDVCRDTKICPFMTSTSACNRKLQVKYEGYLLVKRGTTWSSNGRCRSSSDLLKGEGGTGGLSSPPLHNNSPPKWCNKIVNVLVDEVPNGLAPLSLAPDIPVNGLTRVTTNNCNKNQKNNNNDNTNNQTKNHTTNGKIPLCRTPKKHDFPHAHRRLCRKKSKSQDSLSRGTVAPLNNSLLVPPSLLGGQVGGWRSEGSIHSGVQGDGGQDHDPPSPSLARKLLTRVSDEVGGRIGGAGWGGGWDGFVEHYVRCEHAELSVWGNSGLATAVLRIPYTDIVELTKERGNDSRYWVRVKTLSEDVVLQAKTLYRRDQWLHSIQWRRDAFKYRTLLDTASRPEVMLRELQTLVSLALAAPLHDPAVCQLPLEIASSILADDSLPVSTMGEEVIITLSPLLEKHTPSPQICSFFSEHCRLAPRSRLVIKLFTPVIERILKHNVDFGAFPHVRTLAQDYVQALNSQNTGPKVLEAFIHRLHGGGSTCPHVRVLPNLVSVCLAAVTSLLKISTVNESSVRNDTRQHVYCYLSLLDLISVHEDWREGLALLLQPVPFLDRLLEDPDMMRLLLPPLRRAGTDMRCDVHSCLLAGREGAESWLDLLSPASTVCVDEGAVWADVLDMLIHCCCKRKKFMAGQLKGRGLEMFRRMADRGWRAAQESLCLMLEYDLVDSSQRQEVVLSLQSTKGGSKRYDKFCNDQLETQILRQPGGPMTLVLPPHSSDEDVLRALSSRALGSLQHLSLAFTNVTCACANQLVKLPELTSLDLWSTQFGDRGLQLISEHLHKLTKLNLCETKATDVGIASLTALTCLEELNLNSTRLSAETFQALKKGLPCLKKVDIAYTDAF